MAKLIKLLAVSWLGSLPFILPSFSCFFFSLSLSLSFSLYSLSLSLSVSLSLRISHSSLVPPASWCRCSRLCDTADCLPKRLAVRATGARPAGSSKSGFRPLPRIASTGKGKTGSSIPASAVQAQQSATACWMRSS